jgi:hypothetical protein
MLRLSRRAMRLTIRARRDELRVSTSPRAHFLQLIWRRARALRVPRESASVRHLHETQFLFRPDLRVSLHMHLGASRASRPATDVWPQAMRQRPSEMPPAGSSRQLRRARLIPESLSSRLRILPHRAESPAHVASVAQRFIARVLMSWPARAADPQGVPRRFASAPRDPGLMPPSAHHARARSGPAESRPERRPLLQRESSFLPRSTPNRMVDRETGGARILAFRSRALPLARLHRREAATAGPAPGNLLAWREVAPVTLHYASPRAAAAVHVEHPAAAPAVPIVKSPAQAAGQSARAASAPALDRAATDRLADEVIRRIERRVRIERERRGI